MTKNDNFVFDNAADEFMYELLLECEKKLSFYINITSKKWQQIMNARQIYVFGAGAYGRETIKTLKDKGITPAAVVVSNTKGTTTDPVKKAMELLPLGKVLIIDTPGYDDVGELGAKRVETTKKILRNCDIAILVTEANRNLNSIEKELVSIFKEREIPYLLVKNKSDIYQDIKENIGDNTIYTSAINKIGIEELKNTIGNLLKPNDKEKKLVGDLLKPKDIVILVTPIDSAAPKNRLILPQQLAIRDIIDSGAIPMIVRETELEEALNSLNRKPYLVITDSQVFEFVNKIVPNDIYLTSFSILMARYKGFLKQAYKRSFRN